MMHAAVNFIMSVAIVRWGLIEKVDRPKHWMSGCYLYAEASRLKQVTLHLLECVQSFSCDARIILALPWASVAASHSGAIRTTRKARVNGSPIPSVSAVPTMKS